MNNDFIAFCIKPSNCSTWVLCKASVFGWKIIDLSHDSRSLIQHVSKQELINLSKHVLFVNKYGLTIYSAWYAKFVNKQYFIVPINR